MIYITGDTHGDFRRIEKFCAKNKTSREDILIILGDACINYYQDFRNTHLKQRLGNLPITLFCIHGNHEVRPSNIVSYKVNRFCGDNVYVETAYPNLIFTIDGEIYNIGGKSTIAIGGAYSVDKYYRIQKGYRWFFDEQPSVEIKRLVETKLEENHWEVDIVLTHTTPYSFMPTDAFSPGLDQSSVDNSTEHWLDQIEQMTTYTHWYSGHFHIRKEMPYFSIVYDEYIEL